MKQMIRILAVLWMILVGYGQLLWSQVGGGYTYSFLNLSPSARVAALGASHIAVADDDVALAALNPALLNPSMGGQLSFSHSFHLAGISHGYAAIGLQPNHWKTSLHTSIQYVDYGDFTRTNELGEEEGGFVANEYALLVGAGRPVNERLRIGGNARFILSQLETYQSVGLAGDLGIFYADTSKGFTATVLLRNIGGQLTSYEGSSREPIPFEMQAAVAKRLQHLPLRFSVIYRFLDRWNIRYDDPNKEVTNLFLNNEPVDASKASIWFDNLFRHFVFNAELLLGAKENFRLRAGYSHLLRQELSEADYRSFAGFTLGVGFKIKKFRLDYGRTNFHIGGGVNQLTISTQLREFVKS